jgi:DNA replication protein DnaC
LLKGEIERRDVLAIERNIKQANFPELKMLADFDFSEVQAPTSVAMPYFTECEFVNDRYNLFLYGKPGTGKTHCAIALGIEACKRLKKIAFYRFPDLIQALRDAKANKDAKFFKRLTKLDLIIIDEFGYPPRDLDTIQLFFDFITDYCYEKKSLILTSNRTIKEWLSDFTDPRDEKMAHAAIDRLAQDTLLFTFLGESHRVLQSKMTSPVV